MPFQRIKVGKISPLKAMSSISSVRSGSGEDMPSWGDSAVLCIWTVDD